MGYRKLGRNSSARKALFRSILTSFFAYERIETTEAKSMFIIPGTKIKSVINWKPEIPARQMFSDLLNHWRNEIAKGKIPLNR